MDEQELDFSRMRKEAGGPALATALRFAEWVRALPEQVEAGASLTTPESWPAWRRQAEDGTLRDVWRRIAHCLEYVRYPSDDVAFVFFPVVHPDQDEVFTTKAGDSLEMYCMMLHRGHDAWRVHSLAGPRVGSWS